MNEARWRSLLEAAEEALASDPSNRAASRQRVRARAALGEDGVPLMQSHLGQHPDDARGWDLLCAYLLDAGRPGDALAASDRALALESGFVLARYNRACALAELGECGRAIEDLTRACEVDAELREMARSDASFALLRGDERFSRLLTG